MTTFFDHVMPRVISCCPVTACRTSHPTSVPRSWLGREAPTLLQATSYPMHFPSTPSSYPRGKRGRGFLSQMTVSDTPRPVSSYCTMNIIMVLRMSERFWGREMSVSFVIHCTTTARAVHTIAGSACLVTMQMTRLKCASCRSGENLQILQNVYGFL